MFHLQKYASKYFLYKTLFELHEKPSNVSELTHNGIINDLNINTVLFT